MAGGRPKDTTKLTPELQEQICTTIRAGNYIETAAAYVGVSKPTLYAWMKRGHAQQRGIYRSFLNAVGQALAHAETLDVANIAKAAGGGDWKASAWRLERKFPDRWGRRDKVTILQALAADVEAMTDDELLAAGGLAGVGDPAAADHSGSAAAGLDRDRAEDTDGD